MSDVVRHGRRRRRCVAWGLFCGVIPLGLVAAPARGATNWQIYEKFNYNPSWDGLNNTTSPHNFGYSSTSHTGGGDSLEAGGTIGREDNPRGYYAANIGSLSLSDPLKMTGTLNPQTPNSGSIFLGFFNSGSGGDPQNNSLGLYLDGQGSLTDVYTRAGRQLTFFVIARFSGRRSFLTSVIVRSA